MLKVMFAITCTKICAKTKKPTERCLMGANQGRSHYETLADAKKHLKGVIENNTPERLKEFGFQPDSLRADPIFSYDHGDAFGYYDDELPEMDATTMKHLVAWVNKTIPEDRRDVQPDFSAPSWSTNRSGTVSQAGMVMRMVSYIKENKIPSNDWEWPVIGARVQEAAQRGEWI